MKKLSLVLQAELEIPDDWELVEHSSGIYVLKVGDRFVDFDITPLVTASTAPDATWSDEDEKFTDDILDMVTGLDSQMEITYLQRSLPQSNAHGSESHPPMMKHAKTKFQWRLTPASSALSAAAVTKTN